MSFIHDRRGQSVVIGTVILFGFLVVALAVYQAQVVPQENAQVEFEHSQEVENDVNDLRNAILRAGSTGSAQSQRIRLGTRYPQRTFFVNPPPATGSIETTDPGTIQFENADIDDSAHENVRFFWENESGEFQTRSIQYTSDYNEFREAPTLTYEHSIVAAEFDDAVLFRSGQSVLRDNRLSLTTVSGDLSESGVEARSVDADPISQGARTVPVTGDNGDIEVVLPTAIGDEDLAAAEWADRLPEGADVESETEAIRITLPDSSDPYRLRLSNVSVDGTGNAEPAYIVPVGSDTVAPDGEIGVEVRDKYNNPVTDADVDINGDDFTTDDDGRVFTTVGSDDVVASIGPEDWQTVTFTVRSEERAEEDRTFRTEWDTPDDRVAVFQDEDQLLPPVSVTDRDTGDPIVDAIVDVSYSVIDAEGGGPDSIDAEDRTDSSGQTTVNFDASDAEVEDEFHTYVSAGDDVDRIEVEIIDEEDFEGPTFATLTADESQVTGDRIITFDWSIDGTFDQIILETDEESITTTEQSGPVDLDTGAGANRQITATVEGPDGSETCTAQIGNNDSFDKDDFDCTISL